MLTDIKPNLGIRSKGDWTSGIFYIINDVVSSNGKLYICILNHTSDLTTEPPVGVSYNTYWNIFADIPVDTTLITYEPTGFPYDTPSVISFDDSSATLTISGSYDYYIHGTKYSITESKNTAVLGQGRNFFYLDSNEQLNVTQTFNTELLLRDSAYVAVVYWDGDNHKSIYVGEERHGVNWDWNHHAYQHYVNGTRYQSGLGIIDITCFGTNEQIYNADSNLWSLSIIANNANDFVISATQNHTTGGTFSLDFSGSENNDVCQFYRGSFVNLTDFNVLSGWIYITQWDGTDDLSIYCYDTINDSIVGSAVNLSDYINVATLNTWQKFEISLIDMTSAGLLIDSIRITMVGSGFGFQPPSGFLDDLIFEYVPDATNADLEFGVADGIIRDEDLLHNISQVNKGDNSFRVFYRTGSDGRWTHDGFKTTLFKNYSGGSNRVAWNEFTGGVWKQTEVLEDDYTLVHVFATNDINNKIVGVQAQTTFSDVTTARDAALADIRNIVVGDMPFQEFYALASVVIRTSSTLLNDYKASFVYLDPAHTELWSDFRRSTGSTNRSIVTSGSGIITDHGQLSGLLDDDHLQYLNNARGDLRYSKLGHDHTDLARSIGSDRAIFDVNSPTNLDLLAYDSTSWINIDSSIFAITTGASRADFNINAPADEQILSYDSGTGTWINATAPVFGTQYQMVESLAISTTTSTAFQTKVTLTTPSLPSGLYRVGISYGWNRDATNSSFESRLQLGGVTQGEIHRSEVSESGGTDATGTTQRYYASRVRYHSLSGVNTFTLQYRSDTVAVNASMWEARIEIWRVS